MKPSEVAAIDCLALAAVELHRQGKPPTQVLPQHAYGDPAKTIKFAAERERDEAAKRKRRAKAKLKKREE